MRTNDCDAASFVIIYTVRSVPLQCSAVPIVVLKKSKQYRKQYRVVADDKKGELMLYRADDGVLMIEESGSDDVQVSVFIIMQHANAQV